MWGFVAHCPRLTRRFEARKRAPQRGRDTRDDPEPLNAIAESELTPLTRLEAQGHDAGDDRRDREAAPGQRLLEEEHAREGPAAVSRDAAV